MLDHCCGRYKFSTKFMFSTWRCVLDLNICFAHVEMCRGGRVGIRGMSVWLRSGSYARGVNFPPRAGCSAMLGTLRAEFD